MYVKIPLIVAAASAFAAAALSAAEPRPFVFATNGLAKAAVVIAPDAPAAVRYAAGELADYLNCMTGAHFPVAEAPIKGWNTIRIGLAP